MVCITKRSIIKNDFTALKIICDLSILLFISTPYNHLSMVRIYLYYLLIVYMNVQWSACKCGCMRRLEENARSLELEIRWL